ncbi:MAG: hypothetical protein ABI216_11235 [Devosia sp.]
MSNLTAYNIGKGLIAGLAATVVLSLLMVMKQMTALATASALPYKTAN